MTYTITYLSFKKTHDNIFYMFNQFRCMFYSYKQIFLNRTILQLIAFFIYEIQLIFKYY